MGLREDLFDSFNQLNDEELTNLFFENVNVEGSELTVEVINEILKQRNIKLEVPKQNKNNKNKTSNSRISNEKVSSSTTKKIKYPALLVISKMIKFGA